MVEWSEVECSVVECSAVQCHAVLCCAVPVQCDALPRHGVQHTAMPCRKMTLDGAAQQITL